MGRSSSEIDADTVIRMFSSFILTAPGNACLLETLTASCIRADIVFQHFLLRLRDQGVDVFLDAHAPQEKSTERPGGMSRCLSGMSNSSIAAAIVTADLDKTSLVLERGTWNAGTWNTSSTLVVPLSNLHVVCLNTINSGAEKAGRGTWYKAKAAAINERHEVAGVRLPSMKS